MLVAMAQRHNEELVHVPRSAVRFPIELPVPAGFVASEPETWPIVEAGSLESPSPTSPACCTCGG